MILKKHWWVGRIAVVTLLGTAVGGCAGLGPLRAELSEDVTRPHPGVIILLCDGLSPDLVSQGVDEGWLPNIEKRFVAAGTRVEHAVTAVPSITYGAITTILTGVTPATHGIPGNHWFDPRERMFRNYATIASYRHINGDFSVPTIYECIDPLVSSSIQAAHIRGVTDNIANWAQSGVRWFFKVYTGVDALTATTIELVAERANRRGNWPALLTCYFPGVDTIGHRSGVSSDRYRAAAKHFDHHLGRICDWLEAQGLLEDTYLVLLSDHGMVDVNPGGCIDLMYLVRDVWGRNATDRMFQEGTYAQRSHHFDRYDTVVCWQDGRRASLYFAGEAGWSETPSCETVAEIMTAPEPEDQLWNVEGVDIVAYLAGENEAIIRSGQGEARIVERESESGIEYRYVPVPDDVLGYLEDDDLAAFVAAGFHESRDWMIATSGQTYPDLVPHIVPLLRHRRFGRVLVFTAPGYSFNAELGGHGGVRREEMEMVMMFAGPGITSGATLDCARSVDIVPTLMTWLGVELPEDGSLDGVPLLANAPARAANESIQP